MTNESWEFWVWRFTPESPWKSGWWFGTFFIFPYIYIIIYIYTLGIIIPTDFHIIFFRGVGQPPTSSREYDNFQRWVYRCPIFRETLYMLNTGRGTSVIDVKTLIFKIVIQDGMFLWYPIWSLQKVGLFGDLFWTKEDLAVVSLKCLLL